MVKIVASDIGGTLTNKENGISDFTIKVIHALPVPFCFVTGFNRFIAFKYFDMVGREDAYMIAQNGAFVYHGKKLLMYSLLDKRFVKDIVDFGIKNNCIARVFCTDNNVYCFVPEGYTEEPLRWDKPIYKIFNKGVEDLPADVIQVGFFERVEKIERITDKAIELFGDIVMFGPKLYGTHQWLEFNNPAAKKHIAFKKLADYLKIDLKDAMYCGDNYNDIELLKIVGEPVVVGDAEEEIKKYGKHIVDAGYNDGVAKFLVEYFKLKDFFRS